MKQKKLHPILGILLSIVFILLYIVAFIAIFLLVIVIFLLVFKGLECILGKELISNMGSLFPMVCILLTCFLIKLPRFIKDRRSPVLTVDAVVASKKVSESLDYESQITDYTYSAVFRADSGETLTFQISSFAFDQLREGNCGKLTYQGSCYRGFVCKKEEVQL